MTYGKVAPLKFCGLLQFQGALKITKAIISDNIGAYVTRI
ncbi:rCG28397 [Rattus norvegicus]|uniref:RCG28397 n=1 Tax=Rattus norvegicus TaxID=10116 RepID=A6HVK5_RAT|nr:rCG28397 [Rattus norvegicus]